MFKLPELPFDQAALEPAMSRDTLATYHGKHHAAYVKKMNDALKERADAPQSVEGAVRLAARERDAKLFNNATQAWNHAFFWQCLSPEAQQGPAGALKAAIEAAHASLSSFRGDFVALGEGHFGSGWIWLVSDRSGAVRLEDSHDAHSPIEDPALTPLLACDLWEHAYYLDHKNERGKFLSGFVETLANWRFAEAQYGAVKNDAAVWRFPV